MSTDDPTPSPPALPSTIPMLTLLLAAALASPPPLYLVVHPPALAPAAADFAALRADVWTPRTLEVPPAEEPASLRRRLRDALLAHAAEPGASLSGAAVLLLGDADALPPWRFHQHDASLFDRDDPAFASDHPFQLLDDADEIPDFALGRIPARDNAQARALLAKTRDYEADPDVGPWLTRVAYIAGEGRFGPMDRILERMFLLMIDAYLPPSLDVRAAYAKPTSRYCPPPESLPELTLASLDDGALLFNYVGHASQRALDRMAWRGRAFPILRRADVESARRPARARTPVALFTCCSVGWFDLPGGEPSLGETILFAPAGSLTVIAGSRPTHPYGNAVFQKELTAAVLRDDLATVGEADLAATRALLSPGTGDAELDTLSRAIALAMRWPTTLEDHRLMHARLYNLLGDPAARIRRPALGRATLELTPDNLSVRFDDLATGSATLFVETARTSSARAGDLLPVHGPSDPDLPAKLAHNFPLATDRVLWRSTVPVADSRASWPLSLPPNARVLRVEAFGIDALARPTAAADALLLPDTPRPNPK